MQEVNCDAAPEPCTKITIKKFKNENALIA